MTETTELNERQLTDFTPAEWAASRAESEAALERTREENAPLRALWEKISGAVDAHIAAERAVGAVIAQRVAARHDITQTPTS